jgi:hypothetical protein
MRPNQEEKKENKELEVKLPVTHPRMHKRPSKALYEKYKDLIKTGFMKYFGSRNEWLFNERGSY